MTLILRTSRQASNIFGLGGSHAPRPKNLFYVSFTRGTDSSAASISALSSPASLSNLSFLVKSCERPQVQPVTEEISEYNKKRIVHTGVRYAPLRISFYDTVDSLALQVWANYASQYFGAFGHGSTPDDYLYDATINGSLGNAQGISFLDTSGTGWGFAPAAASSSNTDVNSQYYLRSVSIFEVWGNNYVQTDIINPKIIAFDPEGLSFEDSQIGIITMSLAYEAVVYQNNGVPQPISSGTSVGSAFSSSGAYAGNTIDYPGGAPVTPTNDYTDYQFAQQTQVDTPYILTSSFAVPEQTISTTPYLVTTPVTTDGPLATYGDFIFGDGEYTNVFANSEADLLNAALINPAVANALNATAAELPQPSKSGVTVPVSPARYSSAQVDVATASVAAVGTSDPPGIDTSYYVQQLAAGAMSAASASEMPREQIYTQNPSIAPSPNSWAPNSSNDGIALSPAAYGAVNANRPASAQIGFNTRTIRSQSG